MADVVIIPTTPYSGQRPGTSGLRKQVTIFQQVHYIENFIQSILDIEPRPDCLVIGGDGRFYNREAMERIICVCAGNGVARILATVDGILSTPAASAMIRRLGADGGIILTASHNPGGPDGDLGIKYNRANGGPAPEWFTERIYQNTCTITHYTTVLGATDFDFSRPGSFVIAGTQIDVLDPVDDYVSLLREIFDFELMKELFTGTSHTKPIKMLVDCMNGVMGPYAKRIFVQELGASEDMLINAEPMPDFGGIHPDPNLTYAHELLQRLKADPEIRLGIAFDGDGDRHMVLGQEGFFVTPGDSLAVVAANLKRVKVFREYGFRGFARSFATAPAIDRVAHHFGLSNYVTPTGWKFFGTLLDSSLITLCGEESFGVGADHIREKDGIFAALVWLTVMAHFSWPVVRIVKEHWRQFGRDYFLRYDFEGYDPMICGQMMTELEMLLVSKRLVGTHFANNRYQIALTGSYEYCDPVDGTVSTNQGLYVKCVEEGKFVFRLSGTGSVGATVRVYFTDFSREQTDLDPHDFLRDLIDFAYSISRLPQYLGTAEPTVIT